MKRFFALAICLTALACSNRAYFELSPTADFSGPKTYAFLARVDSIHNDLLNNDIIDEMIKNAITSEMNLRSYTISTSQPENLVRFHVAVENVEQEVFTSNSYNYPGYWYAYPMRYPYYYFPGPVYNQVRIERFKEGTLIIDVIHRATGKLIWRGWTVGSLDDPLRFESSIPEMVKGILENYPVRPRPVSSKTIAAKPEDLIR